MLVRASSAAVWEYSTLLANEFIHAGVNRQASSQGSRCSFYTETYHCSLLSSFDSDEDRLSFSSIEEPPSCLLQRYSTRIKDVLQFRDEEDKGGCTDMYSCLLHYSSRSELFTLEQD